MVLIALWWLPYAIEYRQYKCSPLKISLVQTIDILSLSNPLGAVIGFVVILILFIATTRLLFSRYTKIISHLPVVLMMLLMLGSSATVIVGNSIIASILLLISATKIANIDFRQDNTNNIFNAFVLLVISSLFTPQFILFLPLFVIGVMMLEGVKQKSMLLMVFILAASTATLFGYAFLINMVSDIIVHYKKAIPQIAIYKDLYAYRHSSMFIATIFGLVSIVLYHSRENHFKLTVRKTISFMTLLWCGTTAFVLLCDQTNEAMTIVYIIITAFFLFLNFTSYYKKSSNISFILFVIVVITNYIVHLVADRF